jgi:hypothetical protein
MSLPPSSLVQFTSTEIFPRILSVPATLLRELLMRMFDNAFPFTVHKSLSIYSVHLPVRGT